MQIILASGSPRRRELLAQAGIEFQLMSTDIDEQVQPDEHPQRYLRRMVTQKAMAALEQLSNQCGAANSTSDLASPILLLTADTIGILPDGHSILVKPQDKQDAFRMWRQMANASHQVCTAVQATLIDRSPRHSTLISASGTVPKIVWQQQLLECTEVTFVPLSEEQMQRYWQSGEPLDKAGGYAIQGGAAGWVTRINGSYTNVVGLPLAQTLALIEQGKDRARQLLAS